MVASQQAKGQPCRKYCCRISTCLVAWVDRRWRNLSLQTNGRNGDLVDVHLRNLDALGRLVDLVPPPSSARAPLGHKDSQDLFHDSFQSCETRQNRTVLGADPALPTTPTLSHLPDGGRDNAHVEGKDRAAPYYMATQQNVQLVEPDVVPSWLKPPWITSQRLEPKWLRTLSLTLSLTLSHSHSLSHSFSLSLLLSLFLSLSLTLPLTLSLSHSHSYCYSYSYSLSYSFFFVTPCETPEWAGCEGSH